MAFEFVVDDGQVFRFNPDTGEAWHLETESQGDKEIVKWIKIQEA